MDIKCEIILFHLTIFMGKKNCKIRALQYINRLIVEYGSLSIKVLVELNISFFLLENQRNFNIIIIIIIVRYEI